MRAGNASIPLRPGYAVHNSSCEQLTGIMRLLRTLTYCWLLLHPIYAYTQELPAQTWYNYNAENGLPQNSGKSIAIDRQGYLWIATEMGLARFDGKNFRTFNKSNTPVLSTDRIDYMDLQSNGQIYFTDPNRKVVYTFNTDGKVKGDSNWIMYRHHNGYFAIDSIWKYPESKLLETMFGRNAGIPFMFHASGNHGTGFMVSRIPSDVAYLKNYRAQWKTSIPNINRQKQGYGIAWHQQFYATVNSWDQLIAIDTLGKKSFVQVYGIIPGKKQFSLQNFKQVFEYNGHAYLESGKYIWELSWQGPASLLAKPLLEVSNAVDFHQYLHEPSMGMHVFGTSARGIFIAKQQQFRSLKNPAAEHNIYYAQASYRDSGIITERFIFLPHQPVQKSPPHFYPYRVFRDRAGYYWSFKPDTILRMDDHFRISQTFVTVGKRAVNSLRESPGGTLWFTVDTRKNELQLGKYTGDSINWVHSIGPSPTVVEPLLPISDSLFWIGHSQGILEVNLITKTKKNFPLQHVRRLYQDRKGFIWIGTYGSGFYVWNKQRFFKLPADRNGYLNTVHAFLEDNNGFLWITTNKGLFQAKLKDVYDYLQDTTHSLYYHYYDKTDGLPSSEFNGGCTDPAIILKNGTFSLSTMDGIVQFHPDSIRSLFPSNKIYIDEMIVDSSHIGNTASISLPASFNRLTISISSPYFGNPYNQQLEYNLAGLDDKWYPVNEDNKIIFNKLDHGSYQLRLRKKAGFGLDNYMMTRLPFTVQPGFLDTWAFKILALAGVLLLFTLFVRFRTRYLVKRKKILELEVAARTVTQLQLIDELQLTVGQLQHSREELFYNNRFKEKLALLITHDLQSPLRFLTVMADHLREKAAERKDHELSKGSEELKNASQEIHSFVEEFGLWATTQQENFKIHVTRFSLSQLLEELQRFFKEMMASQGNTLLLEADPAIKLHTDRQLLKIVLRNLIDNANKYTNNGIIRITLETKNDRARILVRDNGNGMPPAVLQKLQARILHASKATILDKDSRLGYQVIIDFIDRLGARITLDSNPENGTQVIISEIACSVSTIGSAAVDGN